jgi:hypothetical protein
MDNSTRARQTRDETVWSFNEWYKHVSNNEIEGFNKFDVCDRVGVVMGKADSGDFGGDEVSVVLVLV